MVELLPVKVYQFKFPLTHYFSLDTSKRVYGKKRRPGSDATECGV